MHAYLDITIDSAPSGRIVLELFPELAPLAVENFLSLLPEYKNTIFHRVLKNFVIQSGDIVYGKEPISKDKLGTGQKCTVNNGMPFPDENTTALEPFTLCMANNGPNQNACQFFITTYPQPHLTGKHTVFGHVVAGKAVVREVERVDTDKANIPTRPVLIADCGVWTEEMGVPVYNASYDTRGGDIFEEFPEDDVNIDKDSSESVYNASVKIKESGTLLFKAGEKQQAYFKWVKCMRYMMEYFPDIDQEPEWYAKYMELKRKVYLNMSLVCLQLKRLDKAVDFSSYLLDIPGTANKDRAKAYFRMGSAYTEKKQWKKAKAALEEAQKLVRDEAVDKALERAEKMLEAQKEEEKSRYGRFFK